MKYKGTVDLFTIICTTCKSRLKVRDQAAVGQILACPKCGGMVMVKPPPAWNDAGAQPSDVPTATELTSPPGPRPDQTVDSRAFDMVDELLSDAPPKAPQPPPRFTPPPEATPGGGTAPKPRFVGGPPRRQTPPPNGAVEPKPVPAPSPEPIRPAAPATMASGPAVPPPPAESEAQAAAEAAGRRAARPRSWVFLAAAIALGATLAVGAVVVAILLRARTVDRTAPAIVKQAQKTGEKKKTPAVAAVGPAAAPDAAVPLAVVPEQPTETVPAVAPAPAVAATKTAEDPLGMVTAPPSPAPPAAPDSQSLAKFDRLIGAATDERPEAAPAPAPVAAIEPDRGPPRPTAPRPPPREVDVTRRLADPLVSIETAGTPLADFVQLLSDMSTIPITLELPFAPATADSAVALRQSDTTVGGALKAALATLRLEYVTVDDQLVVRRQEPAKPTAFTQSVKDLTGGDADRLAELAETLQAVVDPAEWEADGGGTLVADAAKSSLVITHRRAVQFDVLLALEKLRATRRPPLKPELKLDAALFKPESRSSLAKEALARPISLNYSQPTRLVTILERLGEAAKMRLVVDWVDVAGAGWNPAGDAKLLAANQPLSAALDALLQPLDLTWRVIDGQTIQVVTPARLARQGEFELYPAGDLLQGGEGEALVSRAKAALDEASFREAGGVGEIRYDAGSQCLLAWLPQGKQRELEGLLVKWRLEK